MKQIKIFALIAFLLVSMATAFAQDTITQPLPVTTEQVNEIEVIAQTPLADYFLTLAALVPLVTLLAAWVNKKIRRATGVLKQTIAWIIAVIVALAGWYFKLGVFEGLIWWHALLYGLALGLTANGFFDIKLIQSVLGIVGIGKVKK